MSLFLGDLLLGLQKINENTGSNKTEKKTREKSKTRTDFGAICRESCGLFDATYIIHMYCTELSHGIDIRQRFKTFGLLYKYIRFQYFEKILNEKNGGNRINFHSNNVKCR